jgi:hypothetical protein
LFFRPRKSGTWIGDARDAVELDEEIEVPPVATELAIRHGAQPDLLLTPHDLAHGVVLDDPQVCERQPAGAPARARFGEPGRPQQAADVVGAEWRLHRAVHRAAG